MALEIALGAGMQNIVVDREEDGKAAIGYLKQRNGGRATFLPMTAVRGDTLRAGICTGAARASPPGNSENIPFDPADLGISLGAAVRGKVDRR